MAALVEVKPGLWIDTRSPVCVFTSINEAHVGQKQTFTVKLYYSIGTGGSTAWSFKSQAAATKFSIALAKKLNKAIKTR